MLKKMLGIPDRDRFDVGWYIKTKSGSLLAFIKMLEAVTAGICIVMLVFIAEKAAELAKLLTEAFRQSLYFTLPDFPVSWLTNLLRYPLLVPVIILVLIILDGIGVLMMRYGSFGEGLVRFVHTVYWIASIAETLCVILGMIRFISGAGKVSRALEDSGSAGLLTAGIMGFVSVYFIPILIGLLFTCNYHHDIRVVLKTVQKERITGHIAQVGKNHFSGRCLCLALGTGFYFLFSVLVLITPVVTREEIFSADTLKSLSDYLTPMVLLTVNAVLAFLAFIKYLSLRICMRNFLRIHKH